MCKKVDITFFIWIKCFAFIKHYSLAPATHRTQRLLSLYYLFIQTFYHGSAIIRHTLSLSFTLLWYYAIYHLHSFRIFCESWDLRRDATINILKGNCLHWVHWLLSCINGGKSKKGMGIKTRQKPQRNTTREC